MVKPGLQVWQPARPSVLGKNAGPFHFIVPGIDEALHQQPQVSGHLYNLSVKLIRKKAFLRARRCRACAMHLCTNAPYQTSMASYGKYLHASVSLAARTESRNGYAAVVSSCSFETRISFLSLAGSRRDTAIRLSCRRTAKLNSVWAPVCPLARSSC